MMTSFVEKPLPCLIYTKLFVNLCQFLVVSMWVFFWFQFDRSTFSLKLISLHQVRLGVVIVIIIKSLDVNMHRVYCIIIIITTLFKEGNT